MLSNDIDFNVIYRAQILDQRKKLHRTVSSSIFYVNQSNIVKSQACFLNHIDYDVMFGAQIRDRRQKLHMTVSFVIYLF